MKEWLNSANEFELSDYSVPEEKELPANNKKKIEKELGKHIQQCQIFIIPLGMYTVYSEWIEKEINIAESYKKPILFVKPWGSEKTPKFAETFLKKYFFRTNLIGWKKESVIQGVKELVLQRH